MFWKMSLVVRKTTNDNGYSLIRKCFHSFAAGTISSRLADRWQNFIATRLVESVVNTKTVAVPVGIITCCTRRNDWAQVDFIGFGSLSPTSGLFLLRCRL